jgi:hypothetical protein
VVEKTASDAENTTESHKQENNYDFLATENINGENINGE